MGYLKKGMSRHPTPSWKILGNPGIPGDQTQPPPGRECSHPGAELQHKLPTAHPAGVPGLYRLTSEYVSVRVQPLCSLPSAST